MMKQMSIMSGRLSLLEKVAIGPMTRSRKNGDAAIDLSPNQLPVTAPQAMVATLVMRSRPKSRGGIFLSAIRPTSVKSRKSAPYPASPTSMAKKMAKKKRKGKLTSYSR